MNKVKLTMTYRGYTGTVDTTENLKTIKGRIENIHTCVTYSADTVEGLMTAFQHEVDNFIMDLQNGISTFFPDISEEPFAETKETSDEVISTTTDEAHVSANVDLLKLSDDFIREWKQQEAVIVNFIYAVDENDLIGVNNDLPWDIPSDLEFFREMTKDGTVIMGRNTWKSLPKAPLPGRANIVVTRDEDFMVSIRQKREPVYCVSDLEEALTEYRGWAKYQNKQLRLWVIGGAQLFTALEPIADIHTVTRVHVKTELKEGDVPTYYKPNLSSFAMEALEVGSYIKPDEVDSVYTRSIFHR